MFSVRVSPLVARLLGCLALCLTVFLGNLAPTPASASNLAFQQYKSAVCNFSLCQVDFAPPPAGKRIEITSESCEYVTHSSSSKIVESEFDMVDTGNNIVLQEFLVPVLKSSLPVLGDRYAANQTTLIYVPPTYHLRARLSVSQNTGETVSCKLAGTIVTP